MFEGLGGPDLSEMDSEAVERWWDPQIEYVEDPKWPGSGTYRGRDQVVEIWNGYLEVFADAHMDVEEVIDAGDELVSIVRITGTSKGADVPFEHRWGYVCRLHDGKLVYQRAYWDPDEALAAAGVSSSSP